MKVKTKKTRRFTLVLGMIMLLSVVLASCVDLNDVPDIANDSSWIAEQSVEENNSSEDVSVPTEEGHTDAPVITDVINIEPTLVAIYGTCEENAVISVTGGVEDAQTNARGTYYIIEVEIYDRDTLLQVTAKTADEEESAKVEIIAQKDATADTRLDGNSVSVGVDSRLYFDKFVTDASGENLYTASQLNSIRDYVSNTVTSYYNDRAGSQKVELIYVLIPNSATVDLAVGNAAFPEGVIKETNNTIYKQIVKTLSNTRATVVDMLPVLEAAAKDNEAVEKYGYVFRETDSALSDYGAYLTYREIMNAVAKRYPDAAPYAEDQFEWNKKTVLGGNLVTYRELDNSIINEELIIASPLFSLDIGTDGAGTSKVSSLIKYQDKANNNYNFYDTIDAGDNNNGIAERWLIEDTTRELDLPSALIYRDASSLAFTDILTERFGKCLLGKAGELSINLSACSQYAADGDAVVDYILVIISEENFDTAFGLALGN